MPIYRGGFKSPFDIYERPYIIDFHVGNTTNVEEILLGETPCIIEQKSDGLFSPIKSRSASIEIVSNKYIFDLYTPQSRGIRVMIRRLQGESGPGQIASDVVFRGYVVPNVYDQTYTYLDNITINCVDAISTLKDFRYSISNDGPKYRKMIDIIKEFVLDCGYTGTLYIPEIYDKLNGEENTKAIEDIYVSEANFIDDDEERTPWTKYEILEEILRYLGLTLTIDGEDIWLVNYRLNYSITPSVNYMKIDLANPTNSPTYETIDKSFEVTYAGGTSNVSLDGVYNKIEVSDNLYQIDEISPDITNENYHISITEERNMGSGGSKWTKNITHRHFLRADTVETDVTGYQYQIMCRLDEAKSHWKHHFYRHNNLVECDSYYDPLSPTSKFQSNPINRWCNTHGCLIQHYAYRSNEGKNNLPTSLDWEDYLTFFVTDDRTGSFRLSDIAKFEKPVLEYSVNEEIQWKPSSGTSWITIKGDLYYQYNGAKYGEKGKSTLNIVTDSMYQTAPVEKATDIEEQKYCTLSRTYEHTPATYGTGFQLWKFKVQIGDKYWNGTSWQSAETTFYIPYNNNPSNREEEFMSAFSWMSPVPNTDYTDKVGENAYCIPIRHGNSSDPDKGKLKITVYTPKLVANELLSQWGALFGDTVAEWSNLANVIYCKDFDIDYVYTDTSKWYSQKRDKENTDVVYTNIINQTYTNEFDDIEMKINTSIPEKPISRSYATTTGGFVDTLHHKYDNDSDHLDGTIQEQNIIDLWYYHFSESQIRYQCNMRWQYQRNLKNLLPCARYTFNEGDPINTDLLHPEIGFMLDSYSLDLKRENVRLDLVIY